MKQFPLLFLLLLASLVAKGQSPPGLTLETCQAQAKANYPALQQQHLLEQTLDLQLSTLKKAQLPTLTLGLQGSWQSEVISFPLALPGVEIPSPPKEQVKATLDVKQTLWDGGYNQSQRSLRVAENQVRQDQLQVDLYQIRDHIDGLFFSVLLMQENLDQLALLRKDLQTKLDQVQAGIKNGILMPTNATQIEAELLRIDQQEIELNAQITSLVTMLSEWTGNPIAPGTRLQAANNTVQPNTPLTNRPEYALFRSQTLQIDAGIQALSVKRKPKIQAFGQGGYGRPGLNLLDDQFRPWVLVGAGISWDIWDWGQNKEQKQTLALQKEMVQVKKQTFDRQTQLALIQIEGEMSKIQALMQKDDELIALRAKIKQTASVQLDNGVITAADYLTKINDHHRAELARKLHEVQLLKAKAQYQTLIGQKS